MTVVVLDSELEMLDFTINFGDRTTYAPKLAYFFKEGAADEGVRPAAVGEGHHAHRREVQEPARWRPREGPGVGLEDRRQRAAPDARRRHRPAVGSAGLADARRGVVDGRVDNDRIDVGRYEGKFTKLQIVVLDSDLELIDFAVKFGRGAEWRPSCALLPRRSAHARDRLPRRRAHDQARRVQVRNLPGGGRARIQVWGFQRASDAPTPRRRSDLGQPRLDDARRARRQGGRRSDRDKITVGRYKGKFRKLMLVVVDSDLEMIEITVKFGRGASVPPRGQPVLPREHAHPRDRSARRRPRHQVDRVPLPELARRRPRQGPGVGKVGGA